MKGTPRDPRSWRVPYRRTQDQGTHLPRATLQRKKPYTQLLPPWGVPSRRKPRGMRRDCFKLYDPDEGCLFLSRGNEVITQNRYSPLSRCPTDPDYKYGAIRKRPLQDFGPTQHRGFSRRGKHRSLHGYPREDPAYSFVLFALMLMIKIFMIILCIKIK